MAKPALAPPNPIALAGFTKLVARMLDAPVVCVSLVDENRRLVTSSYGLCAPMALLVSWSFVKYLAAADHPLVISDGRADSLVARGPAVRDGTVRAYLGMRLLDPEGRVVGTLSVMDRKPRQWNAPQLDLLREISVRMVGGMGMGVSVPRGRRLLSADSRASEPLVC